MALNEKKFVTKENISRLWTHIIDRLSGKLDSDFGVENFGKILKIDISGEVVPEEAPPDIYVQDTEPEYAMEGDIWIDTSEGSPTATEFEWEAYN